MKTFEVIELAKKDQILVGREEGRQVAESLTEAFERGENVVLSFAKVEMITPSFLDEVFIRAKGHLGRPDHPLLFAVGANEDVAATLQLVLRHNKLMLAEIREESVELLGGTAQLQETLDAAISMGDFTPKDLAEELELNLPALHQRLRALNESGAVSKSKRVKRGKSDIWEAPNVKELKQLEPA